MILHFIEIQKNNNKKTGRVRRSIDHEEVSRLLAIALVEMPKLFSNLITLVFLLMLFVGVYIIFLSI